MSASITGPSAAATTAATTGAPVIGGNNVFLASGTILTTLKEGTKCVNKKPNYISSGLMPRNFELYGMTNADDIHYIQMRIKSRMPRGISDIYSFYPDKYVSMMFVGGADFSMKEDNCIVFQKLTMEIPKTTTNLYSLAKDVFGIKTNNSSTNTLPIILEFPNPGYACDVLKSYFGIEDGYRKQLAEIVEVIANVHGVAIIPGLKGKLGTLDAKRFPKLTAMSGKDVKVPAMYAPLANTINAMLVGVTEGNMTQRINSLLNKLNETLAGNKNSLEPKLERALNQLILFKKRIQAFKREALVSKSGSGTIYDFNMCLQNFFGLYLDKINTEPKGQWGGKKVNYKNNLTNVNNNVIQNKSDWNLMKKWNKPELAGLVITADKAAAEAAEAAAEAAEAAKAAADDAATAAAGSANATAAKTASDEAAAAAAAATAAANETKNAVAGNNVNGAKAAADRAVAAAKTAETKKNEAVAAAKAAAAAAGLAKGGSKKRRAPKKK